VHDYLINFPYFSYFGRKYDLAAHFYYRFEYYKLFKLSENQFSVNKCYRLVSGSGDIKLTKDGNVLLHEMV